MTDLSVSETGETAHVDKAAGTLSATILSLVDGLQKYRFLVGRDSHLAFCYLSDPGKAADRRRTAPVLGGGQMAKHQTEWVWIEFRGASSS